jgi:hypothetical protein
MHSFEVVDITSADIATLELDAAILDNTIFVAVVNPVDSNAAKVRHAFARHHCGRPAISGLSQKPVSHTLDLISQGSRSTSINGISKWCSMPYTSTA